MCKIHTCGNGTALKGLAAAVRDLASSFTNVERVICGRPRGYKGRAKVKISEPWPAGILPIVVCDTAFGERRIEVHTSKRPAIARILRRELARRGVRCE